MLLEACELLIEELPADVCELLDELEIAGASGVVTSISFSGDQFPDVSPALMA